MQERKGSLLADGVWLWRLGASFLVPRSATGVGLATLFASVILPRSLSYIILYPSFRLVFGTLYPAYASYKAVRTKDVKEYVKWMMYWIVFALFTCAETFTDVFLSFWFPFYYELKIIMVIYLLSPATKGSSILYRKFVHPALTKREQEIDEYIARAKEQGYHTVLSLGSKGVNYATSILMQTAIKGGGGLVNQIRKSYSLTDLPGEHGHRRNTESQDELDDSYPEGDVRVVRRQRCGSPRRTVSSGSQVDLYFPEVDVRDDVISGSFIPSHIRSSEDISSGYVSSDTSAIRQEAKEQLVRTSSVSRVRTRAATKGESALIEETKDSSVILVDESQNHCDHLHVATVPLEPPPGGNVLSPFVRPHLQYLFSNLSEAELLALVTSATAQVVPSGLSKPEKCTSPSELLSSLISNDVEDKPNDMASKPEKYTSPSELLSSISNDVEDKPNDIVSNHDDTIKNSHSYNSFASGQTTIESPTSPETSQSQRVDFNEAVRVVRRTKKRQAPVPPLGGSLIDLNRLSQVSHGSDHMEISSVLDFETDFITPDSSPSRSSTSLNENKSKQKAAIDSKSFLQFPKMPFSFWPKSKTSDISRGAVDVQSEKLSDVHDSFISLHEDLNPKSAQPSLIQNNVVREMSQSPSFKRRLDKLS